MQLKGVTTEDFVNYKLPSMFLISCHCDFKCCIEAGLDIGVCQNAPLVRSPQKEIQDHVIYDSFVKNDITKAVVIGGMEPFMQFGEIMSLIRVFRKNGCQSDFVIYTGYYPDEIKDEIETLKSFQNIVIKFGRYIPNRPSRYDDVLGVTLASDNQYAERIS